MICLATPPPIVFATTPPTPAFHRFRVCVCVTMAYVMTQLPVEIASSINEDKQHLEAFDAHKAKFKEVDDELYSKMGYYVHDVVMMLSEHIVEYFEAERELCELDCILTPFDTAEETGEEILLAAGYIDIMQERLQDICHIARKYSSLFYTKIAQGLLHVRD